MASSKSKVISAAFLVFLGLGFVFYVIIPPSATNLNINAILSVPGQQNSTSTVTNPQDDQKCSIRIQLYPCKCTRTLQVANCPSQATNTSEVSGTVLKIDEQSVCGSWATLRGPGQKVVSYSFYGDFPSDYSTGLEMQMPRVAQVYPGWVVRAYLNLTQPDQQQWACTLACKYHHLDVCNVRDLPGLGDVSGSAGTTWRFCVVGDPLVERYMSRDTDSPILQREVDAVDQWLQSGKCFHVMRDNPNHGVSMLSGTFGGCNTWKPSKSREAIDKMLKMAKKRTDDQPALWKHMWPWVKKNVIAHDSYTCNTFQGSLPFPTRRENFTFVGMRIYRKRFDKDSIRKPCPIKCRPTDHQDWEIC